MYKLLFLDLDGTLWDHLDASVLKQPFRRIDDCIVDSNYETLCLYPGVRDFLSRVNRKYIVSTLSWNKYSVVREILETLGLIKFFDYIFIEFTPLKSIVLEKALRIITRSFNLGDRYRILYVDDRDVHYSELTSSLPRGKLVFIHMWRDVRNFKELYDYIKDL